MPQTPVYRPISCDYHDVLLATASKRMTAKIQYKSDIDEFITEHAVIKDVYTQNGEEFMVLSSGTIIRLDRLVSVDDQLSPNFPGYEDYSCNC